MKAAAPPAFEPRSIDVGPWRVTALSDGWFRLDGGAMWGVVPKPLWSAMTPPAPDNTIPLALRPFLAERADTPGLKVLIEAGMGRRFSEKLLSIMQVAREPTLEQSLNACGVAPEEITHVVLSHCHFDHMGAALVERNGELVPLCPNARHFAPEIEIEEALSAEGPRAASYRAENVEALLARGLLEAYRGEAELLRGLRAHEVGGHSRGVSLIALEAEGAGAVFWTDVLPTAHHVQPVYIMAYDLDVERSFEQRSLWIERACARGWIGLFYHDPDVAFGRIVRAGGRYAVESIAGDAR
jgi:glyoxylase-like metal-dependent hydrolase (beta-lactamase superfamily II)